MLQVFIGFMFLVAFLGCLYLIGWITGKIFPAFEELMMHRILCGFFVLVLALALIVICGIFYQLGNLIISLK